MQEKDNTNKSTNMMSDSDGHVEDNENDENDKKHRWALSSLPSYRNTNNTNSDSSTKKKKKKKKQKPVSDLKRIHQYVWGGRILFVLCLLTVAIMLGYATYSLQLNANKTLAESLFISQTDRAITRALLTLREKQYTLTSLATIVSHFQPNASAYPFIQLGPAFQDITQSIMQSSTNMSTLAFIPIVTEDQKVSFEQYAEAYYMERNFTRHPVPSIYTLGPTGPMPDDGSAIWGSKYDPIYTPLYEMQDGDNPILLYNLHSNIQRGRPLDTIMDCVASNVTTTKDTACTTVSELIISVRAELAALGPSAANFAPVLIPDDTGTKKLVGFTGSLIIWNELLQYAFATDVSGIDCVLEQTAVGTDEIVQAFTYTIINGVAQIKGKGEGDLHDDTLDELGLVQSVDLTSDITLFAPHDSIGYKLHFYPNPNLYDIVQKTTTSSMGSRAKASAEPGKNNNDPVQEGVITACIVGVVSILFFLYDFFVRREFHAKKELLESKRQFMRFVSHEVRYVFQCIVTVCPASGWPESWLVTSESARGVFGDN